MKKVWQTAIARSVHPVPATSETANEDPGLLKDGVIEGDDQQAELVRRFLKLGRAALLLRPAIAQSITANYLNAIHRVLKEEMAWVPEGDVQLTVWSCDSDDSQAHPTHIEHTESYYFDRFPVTNRRYQEFVAHGGYSQEAVWDTAIWPRIGEFVDQTGQPGPRYWSDGRYPKGTADEPVVGVNWYEADAFARWSGKRLPSDAEWVRVATCPTATPSGLVQRRFPWGEVWDPGRCNLWIAGTSKIASVHQFAEGSSSAGVQQLIGNVWEWTTSEVQAVAWGRELRFESPLKSLRGGAFDTYFENQATCQLQSGDAPLARRHNVGFRCSLSTTDIVGPEAQS